MDPMTSGGQQGTTHRQSTSALGGGRQVSVSVNDETLPPKLRYLVYAAAPFRTFSTQVSYSEPRGEAVVPIIVVT